MKEKDIEKNTTLTELSDKFGQKYGKDYWRSLEALSQTEEFQQAVQNEFKESPVEWENSLNRRHFLQIMGASLALAGLNACTKQPAEKIIPHVIAPEKITLGKPLFFATSFVLSGYACGVLAESHEGRPTKIEGNPEHPASLGATDIFAQASILNLYDPDRSQVIKNIGQFSSWEAFLNLLRTQLEAQSGKNGAGIRILTETVTSPTLAAQLKTFLKKYPSAKWHQYEPVNRDNVKLGSQLAFGQYVETQYHLENADVALSLDGDFFSGMPGSLVHARKFGERRKVDGHHAQMNRLYAVESSLTLTGAMADHRLAMKAGDVLTFAQDLAYQLNATKEKSQHNKGVAGKKWMDALVRDLKSNSGKCVVIPGEFQAPEVHYLAHAINKALGNIGKTVRYTKSVEASPTVQNNSIRELTDDMKNGLVEFLVILGGNPLFNAPADLNFGEKLKTVKTRVHVSPEENETSEWCHWQIPQSHYLESWSDARAFDGAASIIQPLIAPLYASKSFHEIMAALNDQAGKSDYEIVREYWLSQLKKGDFERSWQIALHDGVVAGTAFPGISPTLRAFNLAPQEAEKGLEVVFRPDPNIWDGRFANNGWLQELPKPISKLTWDNAAIISPASARVHGLENGQSIEIKRNNTSIKAPVWIVPGQANETITLYLGYGRIKTGKVGANAGVNIFPLKTSDGKWSASGISVKATKEQVELASTQDHGSMEGRHLVRESSLADYVAHPELFHEMGHEPDPEMSLYPPYKYDGYAWGMVVDLNACTGCNACTVACQSENNIPIVGKEETLKGREMHWIRVDRYYTGDENNPEVAHQPVMCMHCEDAPCEVVCPVAATTHSDEGLNEMTYNRCVGTRYCSNNCPYKVRRFNFFKYADYITESAKLMHNPDVTVRFRGVMEKCTYCVQRISSARIKAKKEDRSIQDGDIVTACQQVCPTDAIIFGDINDENSRVAKAKAEHRDYGLLAELGTRPRTSYLAKLRNPNPELIES